MDKIQIYITKEELDSILHVFEMFGNLTDTEVDEVELYNKFKKLYDNWDKELEKQKPFVDNSGGMGRPDDIYFNQLMKIVEED